LKTITSLLLITVVVFCQNNISDKAYLFKSGITPFLGDSKFGTITFGFNCGSPALLLDEWQIPDYNKDILFKHFLYDISIYRFKLAIGRIHGNALQYNWNPKGDKYFINKGIFDIGYKIIESKSYWPDFAVDISNRNSTVDPSFCIIPSIGSSRNKLKYYSSFGFWLYYILPMVTNWQIGLSYNVYNNLDIVSEGNISFNKIKSRSVMTGLNYKPIKYFDISCSAYYFRINPNDYLVNNNKYSYYLISSSISFHLWPK
jgi:hypothetical protein